MKLKSYLRGLGTGLFISAVLMGISVSGKTKELSDTEIKARAKALGMVEEDSVLAKPANEHEGVNEEIKAETEPEVKHEEKSEVKSEAKPTENPEDEALKEAEDKKEAEEEPEEATGKTDERRKDTEVAVLEEDPEPEAEAVTDEETDGDIRDSKEDRAMGGQNEKKPSNEKVSGLQNSSDKLGYNEFFTIQIASGSSSETVSRLLKSGGAIDDAGDFDDYLCSNHYDKKITPGVFKIPVGADYKQIADIITGGN